MDKYLQQHTIHKIKLKLYIVFYTLTELTCMINAADTISFHLEEHHN